MALDGSPGCRTRTCSTSAGWPSCSATTASSTRSTIPSRRAATASWGASRGCRSWWCRTSCASSAGWTRSSPPPTRSWSRSRASGRSERRTSARAFAVCRRSTSWTATCRPETETAAPACGRDERRRDTISDAVMERDHRGPRDRPRAVEIVLEIGDNVVYPHHGAGKVLKKEKKDVLGEEREYLTIKILHNDMTVMVPCENAGKAGLRRVIDEETVKKVLAVLRDDVQPDAEELEPPLQAQPRQDQDRRHLRARRGRSQPRHPRAREGPLDRREADVHAGQEDPRVRADVRARDGGGRGRGAPRRSCIARRARESQRRAAPPA